MKQTARQTIRMGLVVVVGAVVVGYGYDGVLTGGNLSRGTIMMLWDARTGKPLLLDEGVSTTAPDRGSHLVVAPSGKVRWYDLHRKRVYASTTVSPEKYRRVKVLWLSARQVALSEEIRYPMLAGDPMIILDHDKGKVQNRAALNHAAELLSKTD